jgi:predicted GIY-YIG superfamily endonuclease
MAEESTLITATVYMLCNKDIPFYVGQTQRPLKDRLSAHKSGISGNWAKEEMILKSKKRLKIIELETILGSKEEIIAAETYWTHQLKAWGFPITNRCLVYKEKKQPVHVPSLRLRPDLMDRVRKVSQKSGISITFLSNKAFETLLPEWETKLTEKLI